jgi:hypothetical protein
MAWTSDGRALVFVGRHGSDQQLYVRELERNEARLIPGTEDAQMPIVSPDGDWIAYWSKGAIRKVAVAGGPSVAICCESWVGLPVGMSWGAGRVIYADASSHALWQVAENGGTPTALTKLLPSEHQHVLPHIPPGEAAVLFTVRRHPPFWGGDDLVAQSLTTGARKIILQDAVDARYLSSRHLVFMRQGTLFGVPFNVTALELRGTPVPVLSGVVQALISGNDNDMSGAGQYSVSPTGVLAYIAGPVVDVPERRVLAIDRHGGVTALADAHGRFDFGVRASPDGRSLALNTFSLTNESIWLYDLARGTLTRLTGDGLARWFEWTPDAQRIVYTFQSNNGAGERQMYSRQAHLAAAPDVLAIKPLVPSSWSPDGGQLLGVKQDTGRNVIWVTSVDGSEHRLHPMAEPAFSEWAPAFSPDGRAVAYGSDVSGRREVYVHSYPEPHEVIQVSRDGGTSPAWNPRGGELFYVRPGDSSARDHMMVADVRTSPALNVGHSRVLFEVATGDFICVPVRCYDVASDGQPFFTTTLVAPWRGAPTVTHIHLVQNWIEELKTRVPTR